MSIKSFKEFIEHKPSINRQLLESLSSVHPVFKNANVIQKALQHSSPSISSSQLHAIAVQGLRRIVQAANEIPKSDTYTQSFLIGEQNALIAALVLFNLMVVDAQQKAIDKLASITQATALTKKVMNNA